MKADPISPKIGLVASPVPVPKMENEYFVLLIGCWQIPTNFKDIDMRIPVAN